MRNRKNVVAHPAPTVTKALLLICALTFTVTAQTTATDGSTPMGLQPGAPAGSYALSGFDNVNLYNGNLNFQLTLLGISGRGGAQIPVMLPIEGKWRVSDLPIPQMDGSVEHLYRPIQSWWDNFDRKYMPGTVAGRQSGWDTMTCPGNVTIYTASLTRLTFTGPDGTEYELRDQLTAGQPANNGNCNTYLNPPSRGTVFVTSDGSAATFISDATIHDVVLGANPGEIYPSGYLMLRDGTKFRIENGLATWLRDRNGNKLTFSYDSNNRIQTITDSLNRQVTIARNTGPGTFDQITYKGFGAASRNIKVNYSSLASALRSDYSSTLTYKALFPDLDGSTINHHNPSVVSSITLPNNKEYQIRYNPYGEIARVVLPTGGAIEYDHAGGEDTSSNGVCVGWESSLVIYRRVTERRLYPAGGSGSTYASRATYSLSQSVGTNASSVTVDQLTNTGTLLTRSKHYFHGRPWLSFNLSPIDYAGWKEGREYQTEEFASNGTTVLRRTENTWQQRQASGWWGAGSDASPANDPRLSETRTTLVDTNQVAKQTFSYDDTVPFNNRSDVYEYDFGSGSPGALKRRTHIDYLKTNPVNSTDYTATSIHIRSLPVQVSVFDAGGTERARTVREYDNYVLDGSDCEHSFHCSLKERTNISGLDSAFTTTYTKRGNATAVTLYLLSNGSVTGSVSAYSQYDVAGNVVRTLDPRSTLSNNIATTIEYDDRYGAPDSEARANSAPIELSGLTSFAFPTKVINALGHTAYSQFDYHLGTPVNGEDANGIVASGTFSDLLDRPTKVHRAIGTGVENQTTFAYDDTLRIITSSSDRDANNDNLLVSKVLYDQMGRTIEKRQYEGGTNYIVTQIQYDALSRPFKSSNPFRPWQSETAVWTTQVFDTLGRVTSVTTPDNAVVSTSYSGNSVTITDQAGKARKSATDALGRLLEVYEDPSGWNYQTSYVYDVLDNLVKVTQGTQQRFFMYDSLKRLIRARNPEQSTNASLNLSDPITGNSAWSIGYQYDVANNLTQKTDPRGVVSVYAYDALNRNTTVDYSDTATINPDVKRFYDSATNGKGRFWHFYSGGDLTTGSNVDHTAVDSYDALGRPLVQRQLFKLNGTWSPTYQITRGYNRAGAVTSQTYPSGRSVTYNYDSAGRLGDKDAQNPAFTGNLGDGVLRTYARDIKYSPWGSLKFEQFGTTSAVYNKLHYNIRGQLCDVRASNANDEWGGELGALVNHYSTSWAHCGSGADNNGNVLMSQTIINSYYMEDRYSYDALNRLTAVNEHQNGATHTGSQQYDYDRYGNRKIKPASWGTGINTTQFDVDPNTNRLIVPGGQTGVMNYDAAGNLTNDTYSSYGSRTYDAENKMTSAQDSYAGWSNYTYDADGHRTRRKINNQETWQIYGIEGELLAEYAANSAATIPQKEYGYRNGQLLVNATPGAGLVGHWKADENTGTTAADSTGNGSTGTLTSGAGWTTGQSGAAVNLDGVNDYVQVGAHSKLVLTSAASFSAWIYATGPGSDATHGGTILVKEGEYVIARYPNGTIRWGFANSNPGWTFIDTGYVAPLNQWTHVAITYDSGTIKTYANGNLAHTYSGSGAIGDAITGQNDFRIGGRQVISQHFQGRIDEVRVYNRALTATEIGGLASGPASTVLAVNWLVADLLGTPRIIIDQTGTLANIKRHDYLPFGEQLYAGTGGRTTALGYTGGDGVRQQFTAKERDLETGLDYSVARYYSSSQGRFTSSDPLNSSGIPLQPQSWNRYSCTINNPLLYVDPKGLIWGYRDHGGIRTFTWYGSPSELDASGDTPWTQSQYFSNQAGTDAVYLGSNGNARHISQEEYSVGVLDEFLRGSNSPLGEVEKSKLTRAFALRLQAEHPEWNFWAGLFGGLAGGLGGGIERGVSGAASGAVNAESLTLSRTVANHLDDVSKLGQPVRPYLNSTLVMREIMEAGKPVPDPGGVPGALRWNVPGSIMLGSARVATQGTWELVIDTRTSTVLHFVFKRQ